MAKAAIWGIGEGPCSIDFDDDQLKVDLSFGDATIFVTREQLHGLYLELKEEFEESNDDS